MSIHTLPLSAKATKIWESAASGHLKEFQESLDSEVHLEEMIREELINNVLYFLSPIHIAVNNDHPEIIQECIRSGRVNINVLRPIKPDYLGSLLHFACINNKLEAIELFMDIKDINVSLLDSKNLTALDYALLNNNDSILEKLLDHESMKIHYDKLVSMLKDAMNNYLFSRFECLLKFTNKPINSLLKARIMINLINVRNERPFLHRAARLNAGACINILTRYGAEINHTNSNGKTAFHVALEYRQAISIRALIHNGCNLFAVCHEGHTAIDYLFKEELFENKYFHSEERIEPFAYNYENDVNMIMNELCDYTYRLSITGAHLRCINFFGHASEWNKKNVARRTLTVEDDEYELEELKTRLIVPGMSYRNFLELSLENKAKSLNNPIIYAALSAIDNYQFIFPRFKDVITYSFKLARDEFNKNKIK